MKRRRTRHFHPAVHFHQITITETYKGERDRGVVASAKASNSSSVLSYSKSRTISNSFSVSIGFDKKVINGAVGYDVSSSDTAIASYNFDVPAGRAAQIRLYDMYDVTKFNALTTFYPYYYEGGSETYTENGTGWSEQWTNFEFEGKLL